MHRNGVRFDLTEECALCTFRRMEKHIDIKALRERINWKQDRLARFLGVDRSSVSHMENGRMPRGPVRRLVDILAAAAEQGTADELFPEQERVS